MPKIMAPKSTCPKLDPKIQSFGATNFERLQKHLPKTCNEKTNTKSEKAKKVW